MLLFVPMLFVGAWLLVKAPDLLAKRLNGGETEREQMLVIVLSGLMFVACFVLSGFDFRFGWLQLPRWAVVFGCVVFVAAYGIYMEVMRENAFLSRTVEIQENQTVVDSGLYGVVRHPMYVGVILLFTSMPVVLGSGAGLIVMVGLPMIMVMRIVNEERVLMEGLPGYREYMDRVKWRLFPGIW